VKRDDDLIREILIAIEDDPGPPTLGVLEIEGYTSEQVSYQLKILAQAGLVEARDVSTFGVFLWKVSSFTWNGHEFLDAARNATVWSKVKQVVAEKGGGIPFDVFKELLIQSSRSYFLGGNP
jgi:hypothetical protein